MLTIGHRNIREVSASIAIVLTLGAILYPLAGATVYARRSQAVEMANLKQLGASYALYTYDSQDVMPIAFVRYADSTWRWNYFVATPADSVDGTSSDLVEGYRSVWVNSMKPYYKDGSVLGLPGGRLIRRKGYTFIKGSAPPPVGINMNGLLHTYNFGLIPIPGRVPLLWESWGDSNVLGLAVSNPSLRCDGNYGGPCRFSWNGPGGCMFSLNRPTFLQNGTQTFLMADLSVVQYPSAGARDWSSVDYLSPHAYWDSKGSAYDYNDCAREGYSVTYPCFFIPDGPGFDPPPPGGQPERMIVTSAKALEPER